MSQLARRLTAAILLAATLSMAAPAVAAAPPPPQSAPAPTVLGTLQRALIWLGSLWLGDAQEIHRLERKLLPVPTSTDGDADRPRPIEQERGAMVDPNG